MRFSRYSIFICSLFLILFAWRWWSYPNPLPPSWEMGNRVRYTATIWESPEYRDTKTIVRNGVWHITLPGYTEIMPGSRVRFEGTVEPKIKMGKVVQMKMVDPKIEFVGARRGSPMIFLAKWREGWITTLQQNLPEPMASLASGILLGGKGRMPSDFYQALIETGTLHIVAASGFNVSVVAAVLMRGAMMVVGRGWAVGVGVVGIVVYVLIAGGSASIVRAGIMGSLTLIAYYFGRPAEARRLLWVTAGAMLLYNPLYMVDIGFQLSLGATIGLLYIGPWLQTLDNRLQTPEGIKEFLKNYFYPTISATVATLPTILYHFGRVSWVSPLVNILVLPVVPLIMLLSALTLVGGQVMAWVAYVPLAYLVWVIRLFG